MRCPSRRGWISSALSPAGEVVEGLIVAVAEHGMFAVLTSASRTISEVAVVVLGVSRMLVMESRCLLHFVGNYLRSE